MICQIVGTAPALGDIDQPAKVIRGSCKSFWTVYGMEIEYGAGIRFLCPGQEAFIITLNQANGAINEVDIIAAKILSNLVKKFLQHRSGNVNFSDDFAGWIGSMQPRINLAMIVVRIYAQLMSV